MKYLDKFVLMNEDSNAMLINNFINVNDEDEHFPIGFFSSRLAQLDFETITILYGGNGSGKSTLLNLIAEKAQLEVKNEREWTNGFKLYLKYAELEYCNKRPGIRNLPPASKFLASENIFDTIATRREQNITIEQRKQDESEYYNNASPVRMKSLADYDELKKYNDTLRKSKKSFIRQRAGRKVREFSNGEEALRFFDSEIEENALYLLDEPENSMSPVFQKELKKLIEDSAKYFNCQFIIATHSPFILSIHDAKIYNLDSNPVTIEKWYDLENIKMYYELFEDNKSFFK